jgi:hypothetical protein
MKEKPLVEIAGIARIGVLRAGACVLA